MMADRARRSLILDRVVITLGERRLLGLSATIAPGEILTIMGPSGSGKSTLLAFAGGFLDPLFTATGHIFLGDSEITALPANRRRCGILFQDPLLFPHLSVGGNLLFAIPADIVGRRQRAEQAQVALAKVGLADFYDRDPDTLSGGQKARVALQRVMISQPDFLLLDEPFSKLDADLRKQIRALVFAEAKAAGLPVILVTHDHADADQAGGPVIAIGSGAS